jgi:tripartite-type tricarboxylate transporter receptor subunit TctC
MTNILHRRHFLLTAAAASTGLAGLSGPARAERTVRIIVGFPPGQATDTVARLMAETTSPGRAAAWGWANWPRRRPTAA